MRRWPQLPWEKGVGAGVTCSLVGRFFRGKGKIERGPRVQSTSGEMGLIGAVSAGTALSPPCRSLCSSPACLSQPEVLLGSENGSQCRRGGRSAGPSVPNVSPFLRPHHVLLGREQGEVKLVEEGGVACRGGD